jgi:mRNA interferase MazF
MKRGDIWWANLPPPSGSGPGYRRPVLVVQSNAFNESKISTVLVAVITSNLALSAAPGNVRLSKSNRGLPKASVVNVSQLLTMDRGLLDKRVASLPARTMQRVDAGLKLVLSL